MERRIFNSRNFLSVQVLHWFKYASGCYVGERLYQIGRKLKVRVDLEAKSRSWTKLMFDLEGDEEIWLGIVASLLRPMCCLRSVTLLRSVLIAVKCFHFRSK